MKSMIVASFLVASAVSQTIYAPGFAPYATGYPYSLAGVYANANAYAPGIANAYLARPRTAFDVFTPSTLYNGQFPLNSAYYAAGLAPIEVAEVASSVEVTPAVKLIESEEESADKDVEVVEADEEPIVASGPVEIRRIFPLFTSDLRGAVSNVAFLRPEQVRPIVPADEDDDVSIVVPEFKSLFPFQPFRRF